MSTVMEKETASVQLHEHPEATGHTESVPRYGEVTFTWKIQTNVEPAAIPGRWRVWMTLRSEGFPSRSFTSDVVEAGLNEDAAVTFPAHGEGVLPDSFWLERFESARQAASTGGGPVPEIGFRLIPDEVGTKPGGMIVLNTDMTFYWIIGARNIALTEIIS